MLRKLRSRIDRILLADKSYSFLFERDSSGEVVSLDCETTGFDTIADDVISIAAIKIRGARILTSQAFHAIIRPTTPMEASAIKVHQLREQDGSRPLVGYWIAFDVRMLNKYLFNMLNIHLPNMRIDVSELYYDRKYRNAPPGSAIDLRYASILRDLGLPSLPQHDALNDALGAAQIYVILKDMCDRGIRIPRRRDAISRDGEAAKSNYGAQL